MRVDSLDGELVPDLVATVRFRCELDDCVQWYFDVWDFFLRDVMEVSIDSAQYSLVAYDDDIVLSLHFHNDWFESNDDIAVALSASVSVVVLVFVAISVVFWVVFLDLLVRHTIADAGVELVERLPSQLWVGEVSCSLDGAFECGSPQL